MLGLDVRIGKATPCLPLPLLLLYFMNSCVASFPMTAFSDFLNNSLNLTPATITRYESFCFTPWVFKPLYAYVVNAYSIGGENRRPFIFLGAVLSSLCYVATAVLVNSLLSAFILGLVRSSCEAFVELVLDMVLIDLASSTTVKGVGVEKVPRMQAEAAGARFFGTLISLLAGLPAYGCSATMSISNRAVIGICAFFPAVSACLSYCLPAFPGKGLEDEQLDETLAARRGVEPEPTLETSCPEHSDTQKSPGIRLIAGMCTLLMLLSWTTLRSVISDASFRHGKLVWEIGEILLLALLSLLVWNSIAMYRKKRENLGNSSEVLSNGLIAHIAVPVGFLLLVNVTSSLDSPWGSYYYSLFPTHANCKIQIISIIGSFANLLACFLYSKCLAGVEFSTVLTCVLLFAAFAPLLRLPAIDNDADGGSVDKHPMTDPFIYLTMVNFVSSLANRLAFLSLQVLATTSSCEVERNQKLNLEIHHQTCNTEDHSMLPGRNEDEGINRTSVAFSAGFIYSLYLCCIDYADLASGWLNAPIIESFSVYPGHWEGLRALTIIASLSKAVTVIIVPYLKKSQMKSTAMEASGSYQYSRLVGDQ